MLPRIIGARSFGLHSLSLAYSRQRLSLSVTFDMMGMRNGKTPAPPKPQPSSNKSVPPAKNSTSVASEPKSETTFVTVWWMSQSPYMAEFDNRASAEAAANVRNALMLTITGTVEEAVDW